MSTAPTDMARLIRKRIRKFDSLPTVSSVLRPLLSYLDQPEDQIDVKSIVDLVSSDGSLAAQCLRIANSPLFCRTRAIYSLRGAVIVLGVHRLRDILFTCLLVKLVPRTNWVIDPLRFWQHSLACAVVSRHFAKKINFDDPEQAYLGGLLHDLGTLANSLLLPDEFRAAANMTLSESIPLCDAETKCFGLTHCETGQLLAEHWKLPERVCHVIRYHHDVEQSRVAPVLVALVSLSDTICKMQGLGYGLDEVDRIDLLEEPAWRILTREYPYINESNLGEFTIEMDEFASHVREMVDSIFPGTPVAV